MSSRGTLVLLKMILLSLRMEYIRNLILNDSEWLLNCLNSNTWIRINRPVISNNSEYTIIMSGTDNLYNKSWSDIKCTIEGFSKDDNNEKQTIMLANDGILVMIDDWGGDVYFNSLSELQECLKEKFEDIEVFVFQRWRGTARSP